MTKKLRLRVTPEMARDLGMARAERGTDPAWADHARQAIDDLLRRRREFSADDVWEQLADRNVPPPREKRALGPIMNGYIRRGEMVKVRIDYSRHPSRHVGHVQVYRPA